MCILVLCVASKEDAVSSETIDFVVTCLHLGGGEGNNNWIEFRFKMLGVQDGDGKIGGGVGFVLWKGKTSPKSSKTILDTSDA